MCSQVQIIHEIPFQVSSHAGCVPLKQSNQFSFPFYLYQWSAEISRPENSGLSAALNLLTEAKREIDSYSKGGPIAFADLIQYGGNVPCLLLCFSEFLFGLHRSGSALIIGTMHFIIWSTFIIVYTTAQFFNILDPNCSIYAQHIRYVKADVINLHVSEPLKSIWKIKIKLQSYTYCIVSIALAYPLFYLVCYENIFPLHWSSIWNESLVSNIWYITSYIHFMVPVHWEHHWAYWNFNLNVLNFETNPVKCTFNVLVYFS